MYKYVYDTNALLTLQNKILIDKFYISLITLRELENIKTSNTKDEETKYKARNVTRILEEYSWSYEVITSPTDNSNNLNNDNEIIEAIKYLQLDTDINLIFITDDLSCKHIAEAEGIQVKTVSSLYSTKEEEYTGYKTISMSTDELSDFYSDIYPNNINKYDLLLNEYLLIENDNKIVDKYKWAGDHYEAIPFIKFESDTFGKIVPFKGDVFQQIAMDSLSHHQVTLLGGPAGSGKTFLALGYLFSLLERNKIDRIVIFVNPMGARNAAKLGFYKGTVREKVLSTQVGHVLASKIGSLYEVERLLDSEVLQIIPVVDARGYEVPPHSGVYVLESQNLTSDLLRLILQRTGEDSKVIVDGDRLEQLDSDIYFKDNGMEKMSKVFRGNELFGQVDLKNIYRSKIASLAQQMK